MGVRREICPHLVSEWSVAARVECPASILAPAAARRASLATLLFVFPHITNLSVGVSIRGNDIMTTAGGTLSHKGYSGSRAKRKQDSGGHTPFLSVSHAAARPHAPFLLGGKINFDGNLRLKRNQSMSVVEESESVSKSVTSGSHSESVSSLIGSRL